MVKLKEVHKNIVLSFLIAIIIFFIGTTLNFIFIRLLPGDPVMAYLNAIGIVTPSLAQYQAAFHELGFDLPPIMQYFKYLADLFTGNWGISITEGSIVEGMEVTEIVKTTVPRTIELILLPLIIGLVLGIILGKLSRKFKDHKIGKSITAFIIIGIAIPAFFFGIIFQILFAGMLGVLPSTGIISPIYDSIYPIQNTIFPLFEALFTGKMEIAGDILLHYILPILSLTIIVTALVARQYRSNLENNPLTRSIISNTTTIGFNFGLILTSIILIEVTFIMPNFGYYLIDSLWNIDFFLLIGFINMIIIFIAITTFISNIVFSIRMPKEFESFEEAEPELRLKSPFTIIGLIIVGFFIIIAIFPEIMTSYSFQELMTPHTGAWQPPSSEHPLGQGALGHDVLGRITWGTQGALLVGLGAVIIGLGGGLLLGFIAGKLNELGKNLLTGALLIFYIIPSIILIIFFAAIFDMRNEVATGIILGIILIPSFTRIIANAIFLENNVFKSIVKYIPLQFAIAIIIYVSVGFLGFSDNRIINLGREIKTWIDGLGNVSILNAFWAALFPGLAIILMVAGFLFLYEGL